MPSEIPDTRYHEFMDRMGAVARVTVCDKRADDILAVMDAVGAERASLFGISEGGAMAALVAATHPHRIESLVLDGGTVRMHDSASSS